MSRRKQAKPRSLKRNDLVSDVFEDDSTQDTLPLADSVSRDLGDSPLETIVCEVSNAIADDQSLTDADDAQKYTCRSCNASLETLSSFLEHLNHECMADPSRPDGSGAN